MTYSEHELEFTFAKNNDNNQYCLVTQCLYEKSDIVNETVSVAAGETVELKC